MLLPICLSCIHQCLSEHIRCRWGLKTLHVRKRIGICKVSLLLHLSRHYRFSGDMDFGIILLILKKIVPRARVCPVTFFSSDEFSCGIISKAVIVVLTFIMTILYRFDVDKVWIAIIFQMQSHQIAHYANEVLRCSDKRPLAKLVCASSRYAPNCVGISHHVNLASRPIFAQSVE